MREPANGYPATPSPNRALRATLVEAARAAGRTQATDLGAQYRRMVRTQGKKRVAILGAHTLAVDLWYLLARHTPYADFGGGLLGPAGPRPGAAPRRETLGNPGGPGHAHRGLVTGSRRFRSTRKARAWFGVGCTSFPRRFFGAEQPVWQTAAGVQAAPRCLPDPRRLGRAPEAHFCSPSASMYAEELLAGRAGVRTARERGRGRGGGLPNEESTAHPDHRPGRQEPRWVRPGAGRFPRFSRCDRRDVAGLVQGSGLSTPDPWPGSH